MARKDDDCARRTLAVGQPLVLLFRVTNKREAPSNFVVSRPMMRNFDRQKKKKRKSFIHPPEQVTQNSYD